jgi:hypothetical protein
MVDGGELYWQSESECPCCGKPYDSMAGEIHYEGHRVVFLAALLNHGCRRVWFALASLGADGPPAFWVSVTADFDAESDTIVYRVTDAAESPWIHYEGLDPNSGLERYIVESQGELKRFGVLAGMVMEATGSIQRFLLADRSPAGVVGQ